jgi:hypothetical protein
VVAQRAAPAHLGTMRGTALAAHVGGGPQGRLMARMPFWCGGTLSYSNVWAARPQCDSPGGVGNMSNLCPGQEPGLFLRSANAEK